MFVWAGVRLRWLAMPLVLLNFTMGLSTIISGDHYLTDVIGGVAVGVTAIMLAKAIMDKLSRSRPVKCLGYRPGRGLRKAIA